MKIIVISIPIILLFSTLGLSLFEVQTANAKSDFTIKHWFVSTWNDCSSRNIQALNFYESIKKQYLDKYNFSSTVVSSECITTDEIEENYSHFESRLSQQDLPIVILDLDVGLNYVLERSAWGHYRFVGDIPQHIVFCACSPYVESEGTAHTLSHELSHFVLHQNGNPLSIVKDWVHQNQADYNACEDEDTTKLSCPALWTTVNAPSGKSIKVMAIYGETTNPQSSPTSSYQPPATSPTTPSQPSYKITPSTSSQCFSNYLSEQYNQAITCYESHLKSNPSDTSSMGFLGRSYEGISDFNTALSVFQKINSLEPNNITGLNGIARNYSELGDCQKAVDYYEKVLAKDPNHIEADIFLGLQTLL